MVWVPIGMNCLPAWYLSQIGARHHSLPFDWLLLADKAVLEILRNRLWSFISLPSVKYQSKFRCFGNNKVHNYCFRHWSPENFVPSILKFSKRLVRHYMLMKRKNLIKIGFLNILDLGSNKECWQQGLLIQDRQTCSRDIKERLQYFSDHVILSTGFKYVFAIQIVERSAHRKVIWDESFPGLLFAKIFINFEYDGKRLADTNDEEYFRSVLCEGFSRVNGVVSVSLG